MTPFKPSFPAGDQPNTEGVSSASADEPRDMRVVVDVEGAVLAATEDAERVIALAGGERPFSIASLVSDKARPQLLADLRRAAGGDILRREWSLVRKTGEPVHIEAIAGSAPDGRVQLLLRDISGRPAADAAQAQLAAIITSSTDAIVSKTLTGQVTSWNAAAERLFGYAAHEMIGQSIRKVIPPDRQGEEDMFLAKLSRGERIDNFETVRLAKDGRQLFLRVTVSPMLDASGRIVGASKIARDVSQQRAAEAKVRESDERFRALADNIPQFAWMTDETGKIVWFNQRFYDYTGTTYEEMHAGGREKIVHPHHLDRVTQGFAEALKKVEPWEDTFLLKGVDGQYRWFLSRARPIMDEATGKTRWFGTNTDITEQKQHEAQIEQLMREVNHRSKNMLGVVQSIARRTAATGRSDFIARFGERIQSLSASQDLLVSSAWHGVSLEKLIRAQMFMARDMVGDRIVLDGPAVTVSPSAAQTLGLVFHELATNALRFGALSKPSGMVRISWSLLGKADGAERLRVEWREQGGRPPQSGETAGFGSTVIGPMARMSLGAEVEIAYSPDGLAWTMECDLVRAAETTASFQSRISGEASANRRRVLVVEDEGVIALDLADALEEAGFEVLGPANSVRQALELFESRGCDAAVLDISLGAETSARIAERLHAEGVPFVVVSGYSPEQQPGVFRYAPFFSKPLETPLLIKELKRRDLERRLPS